MRIIIIYKESTVTGKHLQNLALLQMERGKSSESLTKPYEIKNKTIKKNILKPAHAVNKKSVVICEYNCLIRKKNGH